MSTSYTAAMRMRKICFTERGFIGLVPEDAGVGDMIYVLLGGQVLYTLRPVKVGLKDDGCCTTFSFVGEAYLHGLMDGKVMGRVERREAGIQDVVLV